LKQFLDVGASAPLTLSIGGTASLGVVIDLSTPTTPTFSIADSSQVSINTLVNAPDVDLQASIGALGISIRDGHVLLDGGVPGSAATWSVTLAPTASHRYSLTDAAGAVQTGVTGRLDVDLPVYFPTPDSLQGHIHLSVGSLANIAGTTALDTASLPNFAQALSNLNLDDLIGVVIDGLDRALGNIESRFHVPNLPLIGNDLNQATAFL